MTVISNKATKGIPSVRALLIGASWTLAMFSFGVWMTAQGEPRWWWLAGPWCVGGIALVGWSLGLARQPGRLAAAAARHRALRPLAQWWLSRRSPVMSLVALVMASPILVVLAYTRPAAAWVVVLFGPWALVFVLLALWGLRRVEPAT